MVLGFPALIVGKWRIQARSRMGGGRTTRGSWTCVTFAVWGLGFSFFLGGDLFSKAKMILRMPLQHECLGFRF